MNSKLSGILVGVCLLLILCNHYLIDWEESTKSHVQENLLEIIQAQRADLELWSDRVNSDPAFKKRTLCKGRLVEWSDDRPFEYENSKDSISVVENERGVFLFQFLEKGGCQFISEFPLVSLYSINNQYLKNGLSDRLHPSLLSISVLQGDYSLNDLLKFDVNSSPSRNIDGFVALLMLIVLLLVYWRYSKSSLKNFLIGTSLLVVVRGSSLLVGAGEFFFRYTIFDPIYYRSSFFNPTLGDLLLNGFIVLLISMLVTKHFRSIPERYGWVFLTLVGVGLSLLVFHYPWSILVNSQITLDVGESIQFGILRSVSYLSILLVALALFIFLFKFQSYLKITGHGSKVVFFGIFAGLCFTPFKLLLAAPIFFLVFVILISSKVKWGSSLREFDYANLLYILLVAVGIGGIFSFITYKNGESSELDAKQKFANYLLLKRDVLGEFYLDQSVKKLSSDSTIMMIASEGSKEELESKIRSEFVSPYFNKYDLEIVFQDYQRLRVNTRFTRENSLLVPENESDYEDIYFIDEGTNFKYISKVNFGDLIGLVILQIKKRVPTTVYPALLTDSKFSSISDEFDYAVFAGDEILFHRSKFGQGEWPSLEDLNNEVLYTEGIERNGRHYFGVETSDGRTILIISAKYSVRAQLANFSFFFLILLSVFGIYTASVSLRSNGMSLNFTSKIQLYLTMAFMVPLLVTGFALLRSLNTSYKEEINRTYLKQALYISEILSDQLETEMNDNIGSRLLEEIGSYIQSDISFYNESGYLIATSQPDIFSLGLQSNLINPVVFEELVFRENQSMIADESIGSLEYKVCYALVNTVDNQVSGFVAMPFFDSRNHLRRQQIEVFGNLITIFGLIFILAILLGNVVLNNLLRPLRMVAGKIRHVTLQDVNQPIIYESSDEIGSLVKDYNHMLIKLEESKLALARSQKETAWKEIARQVAHEIKNPLTPMQLKIQQMLRKHDPESKDHETLSSLLTQVDTLSQIASSFSAFAEMPAPDNQVFPWEQIVEEVITLYQADNVSIQSEIERGINIMADKDIFRRILNNIVLNAIQSTEEENAAIEITLSRRSEKALLSVRDNGRGVPDEVKDKIFLNYFSTKKTGSGIGLALAKKGIENAGGNIWFESNQGQGTTFFISMPLSDT